MPAASVEPLEVLTVGHSNLSCEQFIRIIQEAGVTAVADVRSAPYSHYSPHFNREALRDRLRGRDISYVFLGHELGGRPRDSALLHQGTADYERMVAAPSFIAGLDRIAEGCARLRIALMCSEHDPLDCHRCLLVGRALAGRQVTVTHIVSDSLPISQRQIEDTLLALSGRDAEDLFASYEERLAAAYRDRARRVAFAGASDHDETTSVAE